MCNSQSPSDGMILTATGLTVDPSMMEEYGHGTVTYGSRTHGHFEAEPGRELVEPGNLVSVSGNRVIVASTTSSTDSERDDHDVALAVLE